MGRPSTFSQEIAAEICTRIAGGQTLREVCRDEGMPPHSTVLQWAADNREGFADQYARARDALMDYFADEILEIAENSENDWMERQLPGGIVIEVPDQEAIARSKLRIETRKWLMGKCAPKRYGDKTIIAGDPTAPVIHQIERRIVRPQHSDA